MGETTLRLTWCALALVAFGCGDDPTPPHDGGGADAPAAEGGIRCEAPMLDGMFSRAFWSKIDELGPLPEPPASPTNAHADDPAAAELGQMLFFDSSYAGALQVGDDGTNGGLGSEGEEGKIACASCHVPNSRFSDTRSKPNATSLGADWTRRNSPPLLDAVFYEFFGWAGRTDSLWSEALRHVERPETLNGSRLAVVHVLRDKYADEYEAVFGEPLPEALDDTDRFPAEGKPGDGAWDSMGADDQELVNRIFANYGKAVAAYIRLLVSRNAPFDQYVTEVNQACSSTAIPQAAKRGLRLFVGKAGCSECHAGTVMTDHKFHNIGVPQEGAHVPEIDTGRHDAVPALLADPFNSTGPYSDDRDTGKLEGLEQTEEMLGRFRTKLLRNVAQTGPYMHTGAFESLRNVVEFYNEGGADRGFSGRKDVNQVPLNLRSAEMDDLVSFLRTLTGDPVAERLRQDTSK